MASKWFALDIGGRSLSTAAFRFRLRILTWMFLHSFPNHFSYIHICVGILDFAAMWNDESPHSKSVLNYCTWWTRFSTWQWEILQLHRRLAGLQRATCFSNSIKIKTFCKDHPYFRQSHTTWVSGHLRNHCFLLFLSCEHSHWAFK